MIEKYAKALSSKVEVRRMRENIYNEILDHLTLSKEDYIEAGFNQQEAEELAIKDFGDEDEIIDSLNTVHQKPKLLDHLLKLSIVVMVLYIVIPNIKAYEKPEDNRQLFNPGNAKEIVYIDEEIRHKRYIYNFKKAALLFDDNVYVYFTKRRTNPFNRYAVEDYPINDNMFFTSYLPDFEDGVLIEGNIFSAVTTKEGLLMIKDKKEIPKTIELTFSDNITYSLELGGP